MRLTRPLTAALAVLLVVAFAAPAVAGPPFSLPGGGPARRNIPIEDDDPGGGTPGGGGGAPPPVAPAPPPPPDPDGYRWELRVVDGNVCVMAFVPGDFATLGEALGAGQASTGYPGCPAGGADPAEEAEQVFRDIIRLPRTRAEVTPARGLTGLPAYLVIDSEPRFEATVPSPITDRVFYITADAEYRVDWGDGSPEEGPTSRRGQPYPGGPDELTHVYADAGTYEITVHADWRWRWRRVEPGSDNVTTEQGTVTISDTLDPLPVTQVQAVRQR